MITIIYYYIFYAINRTTTREFNNESRYRLSMYEQFHSLIKQLWTNFIPQRFRSDEVVGGIGLRPSSNFYLHIAGEHYEQQ